jgi:hypothetical protein
LYILIFKFLEKRWEVKDESKGKVVLYLTKHHAKGGGGVEV